MQRDRSNIRIDQVHPDETEVLLNLYIDLFYGREPLTKCLGLSKGRMISFARSMYGEENSNPMSKGFCWVARDRHAANKEVGFVFCDDPVAEGNHQVPEDISEKEKEMFSAVMALMENVRKPVKDRIGSEAGKCLHVAAVGVAPGYEGAGIATMLLQTVLEHATAREFTHVFSECTSTGSRKCHEKLGFQCLHSVAAGEFSVDRIRPFAQNNLDIYLLWKDLWKRAG